MPEITKLRSKINEAVDAQVAIAGADPDSTMADYNYYRRLGAGANTDLPPMTQERMQAIALLLYRNNPLGHRIIDLIASFAVGGNITFEAEDANVQEVLEKHWDHPINDWERKLFTRVFELGLYGELFMTTNTLPNGDVTLGYISPLRVDRVDVDPMTGDPAVVWIKPEAGMKPKSLDIVRYDALPNTNRAGRSVKKTQGYRVGEVFFFAVNQVSDMARGISDIFPLTEYIDGIDQFILNELERTANQSQWIWDVTLAGMSLNYIKTWLAEWHVNPPKPGAVRAHNEMVTWQALAPNINAAQSTEQIRLLRNYALGGAGLPEHFYGESNTAGRAAVAEMAEPTFKTLSHRQREAKLMIRDVFNYVIDQKILTGEFPEDIDRRFYINMPKISVRDYSRTAGALRSAAQGLDTLLKDGLIDIDRASSVAQDLLRQLDLESDADQERKQEPDSEEDEEEPTFIPLAVAPKGNTKGQNGSNGSQPANSRLQSVPPKSVKK